MALLDSLRSKRRPAERAQARGAKVGAKLRLADPAGFAGIQYRRDGMPAKRQGPFFANERKREGRRVVKCR